ncbi:MAG TPA: type IV pilus twitching motility protein PilT [Longimicrobiales bacterium]|nr:type IV pilus twitching motility protein PilT [Longimicrobiales bacterium]
MIEVLKGAMQRGASDIHFKSGAPVLARIRGDLVPLTSQRLSSDQIRQLALQFITDPKVKAQVDAIQDYDCSFGVPGVGRFRVNVLRQRGTYGIVLRAIPFEIPTLEQLGLPPVLAQIARSERGMVLVTGVTGSGKSTTLAAMLNHINVNAHKHIITLEDPIEFLHRDIQCAITQREVGSDTQSFGHGLRASLREDPDVILVGEMRDTETIDIALKAAETGHLLLSTLHTPNAVKTISRIISVFPPHEQHMVRIRVAESLIAVISQRLLPRKDGNGRVAACEVMVVTSTIRDAIMDPERTEEIYDFIADGREQYGSQTFDQHLMELVSADVVDFETAKAAANNPSDFELKMRMLA